MKAEKAAAVEETRAAKKAATEAAKANKVVVPKHMDPTLLPALVKLVHGRKDGCDKLVAEFCAVEAHAKETKANIARKIKDIAEKRKAEEGHGTARWVVHSKFVTAAGLTFRDADVGEGEDAQYDLVSITWTPPRVKRLRPEAAAAAAGPPPKSARLRGDTTVLIKELGHEWWPEKDTGAERPSDEGLVMAAAPAVEDKEAVLAVEPAAVEL